MENPQPRTRNGRARVGHGRHSPTTGSDRRAVVGNGRVVPMASFSRGGLPTGGAKAKGGDSTYTVGWWERAACRKEDPELFFPVGTSGPARLQLAEAKAVCHGCPVIAECLDWALATGQRHGVWGGLGEDERGELLRDGRKISSHGHLILISGSGGSGAGDAPDRRNPSGATSGDRRRKADR